MQHDAQIKQTSDETKKTTPSALDLHDDVQHSQSLILQQLKKSTETEETYFAENLWSPFKTK